MCRLTPRSAGHTKTAPAPTDWQEPVSTTTWPTRTTSPKLICNSIVSIARLGRSKSCCGRGSRDGDPHTLAGSSTADLFRSVFVPRPFGQPIIDVDDALSIEDVAGRLE